MTVDGQNADTESGESRWDSAAPVRVLIADDHPVMSTALRTYVDSTSGMRCVGEARNGDEAVRMCAERSPHVVIMDLHMPTMDGIAATKAIRAEFAEVAVLAVTTFSTERYVIPALRAGAGGYIVKDAEPEEIIQAIREVHEGLAPFSPAVAHQLMVSVKNDPSQLRSALARFPEAPSIPERELQCLQLLAKGCSNAEIASQMMVSEATVKVYMGRLMKRLEVRDRVQLLIRATELGVVDPSLNCPRRPPQH
ncbi:response regulator transcription factor [Nesterenkonia sp.]|uniref:response regulator transcription factor n=1 Tax=Nesterenkonia sp. TaxID=704201 RepID=UPI002613398A|nr:response regulator transcription factor [Nesterenkonia sp.]